MKKPVRVIQSIQRAFDIINCFNYNDKVRLSLQEISSLVQLNINTTRGIVNTLLYNGYLEHHENENDYSLGLVYISKAEIINTTNMETIRIFARPHLDKIAQKYEVSARLQLVSNDNIFTVETVNPEQAHYIILTKMYQVFPLYATASGKMFLSFLSDEQLQIVLDRTDFKEFTPNTIVDKKNLIKAVKKIKQQGYSIEIDEIGRGVSSVAVPIVVFGNSLFGTISITAFSSIIESLPKETISDLHVCAKNIAQKLDPTIK